MLECCWVTRRDRCALYAEDELIHCRRRCRPAISSDVVDTPNPRRRRRRRRRNYATAAMARTERSRGLSGGLSQEDRLRTGRLPRGAARTQS